MPDCVALAIHTPVGTIIHTGDFKIDQTPLDGEHFDFHRFAELGSERGAGAVRRQHERRPAAASPAPSPRSSRRFEEIFTSTQGKLVVDGLRLEHLPDADPRDLAAQFGRKVAFVGRGMVENSQIAQRLGYLRSRRACSSATADVQNYPAAATSSASPPGRQGEPLAALSRIAIDDHRHVKRRRPTTRVVFSARAIPGNEKAIGRVINHLARRGADVITEARSTCTCRGTGARKS